MQQTIRQLITYSIGSLLAILLGSCRETCFEEQPSLTVSVTSATVKSVRWDILDKTVSGYVIQSRGDLVRDKRTDTQLPLDFNATETRYTLQADGGRVDTLTVRYGLQAVFVSQKCGYALSVRRPAQGIAVRFTRDSLKAAYYINDARPANEFSGYFQDQSVFIRLAL